VVVRAVREQLGGCESSAGISEQQCRESCDTGVTAKVRTGFRRYTDRGSTMYYDQHTLHYRVVFYCEIMIYICDHVVCLLCLGYEIKYGSIASKCLFGLALMKQSARFQMPLRHSRM
jgi:hypothetical protein